MNDIEQRMKIGRMSVTLFVVIALLMAIDLAIDVRRGERSGSGRS